MEPVYIYTMEAMLEKSFLLLSCMSERVKTSKLVITKMQKINR